MAKRFEQYQDTIARLYPETIRKVVNEGGEETKVLSRPITFCVTNACQLRCKYCLPAGTQIKMSDFSSKAIEDIVEGDEILGFEEHNQSGKHTKLQKGVVTQLHHRKASTISLTFENGQELTITPNHKVLVRRNPNKPEYDYREAGKLKVGQTVYMLPYFDVEENFDFVEDSNYIIGYVISMMQGDGCFKYYPDNPKNKYICRLAVKDEEIIDRMKTYLSYLGIRWGSYQFLVSEKDNVYTEALTFNNKASYDILMSLIDDNFNFNTKLNYYKGYLAGLYDAEGHIDKDKSIISLANTDMKIIAEIENALKALGIPYKTSFAHETINGKNLWQVRILGKQSNKYCYKFLQSIHNAVSRKRFDSFYNNSLLKQMKIIDIKENADEIDVYNIGTTCHTYIANNVAVHNCYETHKGNSFMSFETAKKFIDLLLSGEKGMDKYINPDISPAVVIEFIGGEPFLAIDLMDEIMDYWMDRTTELMHPWADKYMISICSNGVAYFEPEVQKFLEKHKDHMSFSVTIDGNKELHNACRVYAGTDIGCYDEAVAAAKDWMDRGYYMGSKVTLAPSNIQYMYDAIMHMVDMGYNEVLANCVYEAEWSNEDALLFYEQGKKLADEFLARDLDFENEFYCSLYEENYFHPKDENDIENWCFPAGTMILTPNGEKPIEILSIGDNVISKDGINPIEDILVHESDDIVKIKASGMLDTFVTKEHPYWVMKKMGKEYSDPQWIPAGKLSKGDKICLKNQTFGNKTIDKNIAYIVGRYVGDGWHSTTGYKLCCSHDEKEELQFILDKANVKYSSYTYPTVEQFSFNSKNGELLSILSSCGSCASNKKLPSDIYTWDEESVQSFLNGYLDADGCYSIKKKEYRCNTVSKELAQELLDLIRSLGYSPICYIDYRAGKSKIEDREVTIKDRYCIEYRPDKYSRFCSHDEQNNCTWTTVRKIENVNEPIEVYNLTVSNEHSFVANGAVVHNCGGNGVMIACDWDGEIYPCIRYMEMSLGNDQPKLPIGNVDDGIMQTPEQLQNVKCLQCVNRRTQSTDECFNCPIAEGCSWCSAWNYQLFGTPDKRCTRICPMHKARCLFNIYFWNKYYLKNNLPKCMDINIPEEWALEIISQEEFDMLKDLYEQAKRNRED